MLWQEEATGRAVSLVLFTAALKSRAGTEATLAHAEFQGLLCAQVFVDDLTPFCQKKLPSISRITDVLGKEQSRLAS